MNADTQARVRMRLAARDTVMLTQVEQGVGGAGRGRGTDTPRAKSATSTICNCIVEILTTLCMGHFIPSGAPMDGKVSDSDKNLVCYVYKYKKLLFKSTFG